MEKAINIRVLKVLFFTMILIYSTSAFSQSATTFILVRHAEKDLTQSTNDPDLSEEGKIRAKKLQNLLAETEISAIYTTPYKRTFQTIQPLAESQNRVPQTYQPMDTVLFRKLVEKNTGGKIVVAGHSNTIPELLNYLTKSRNYKIMGDNDYGKIFIVTVNEIGDATVLILSN